MPLHWIVPARRAVVAEEKVSYADALRDWVAQMRMHSDALLRFYFHGDADTGRASLEAAIQSVELFITRTFESDSHPIAAAEENTVHATPDYYVRLWKGPFRVLLETREGVAITHPTDLPSATALDASASEDAEQSEDDVEEYEEHRIAEALAGRPQPPARSRQTSHAHRGRLGQGVQRHIPSTARVPPERSEIALSSSHTVRLLLDDLRQARPEGTNEFLPGDVIEMPLFKVVLPSRQLEFDPNGSFFLGTSLRSSNGETPPRDQTLHDNLIAMRFQLLIGALRGAFHSEAVVFEDLPHRPREPNASILRGQAKVHARGLLYGGSLNAGDKHLAGWGIFSTSWGTGRNVPEPASFQALKPAGSSLTPAGACSPTMGFMAAYMINERPCIWPDDGVYHDFRTRVNTGPMWPHFDLDVLRAVGDPGGGVMPSPHEKLAEELYKLYITNPPDIPDRVTRMDRLVQRTYALLGIPYSSPPRPEPPPQARHARGGSQHAAPPTDLGTVTLTSLQGYLREITVLALTNHTYSLVRIAPARRLMQPTSGDAIPYKGFISVYDPLSGKDLAPDRPASPNAPWEEEQLYLFEASGALNKYDTIQVCGGKPFRWVPIENNTIQWKRNDQYGRPTLSLETPRPGDERPHTLAIARMRRESLEASVAQGRPLAPLFFGLGATPHPPDNLAELYATRAVPFPTMKEADATMGYPPLSAVSGRQEVQAAWAQFAAGHAHRP